MSADDASILPDLVAGRLSTAVMSDILDDLGHRDHVLDPAIRPLGDAVVVAGWANPFLVAEVDEIPADPYTGLKRRATDNGHHIPHPEGIIGRRR